MHTPHLSHFILAVVDSKSCKYIPFGVTTSGHFYDYCTAPATTDAGCQCSPKVTSEPNTAPPGTLHLPGRSHASPAALAVVASSSGPHLQRLRGLCERR